jgi:protein translocase SecG subunit
MTQNILMWIQIGVAVLLAISILLQNRGAGLSASFGGDYGGYYTKRGMEKFLYWGTIILATIFLVLAVVIVYMNSRAV